MTQYDGPYWKGQWGFGEVMYEPTDAIRAFAILRRHDVAQQIGFMDLFMRRYWPQGRPPTLDEVEAAEHKLAVMLDA